MSLRVGQEVQEMPRTGQRRSELDGTLNMTRIVDYAPSDEQSLVSRVLLAVNKAADEAFPEGPAKDRGQVKTVLAATPPAVGPGKAAQVPNPRPQHASAFSRINEDSDFDYIVEEKQRSRKWIFLVIMMATAAFVALALLIANRDLR